MTESESQSATPDAGFGGRLAGRTVIVTGGASGLGRVHCGHLAAHGARVVVADVDGDGADATARLIAEALGPGRAVAVEVDATSRESAERMVEAALAAFGTIDVLINNVGSYPHVDFPEITLEGWRDVMRVNLESVFVCCAAALPAMRARGAGKIINVATNLVWIGLPSMSHYVAAKAGVVGFTRSLAREVGPDGITVNALAPGAVAPPRERLGEVARERLDAIVERQCVPRAMRAEDLVGPLVFLVSDDSDFLSGQVLTVDGGLTTH